MPVVMQARLLVEILPWKAQVDLDGFLSFAVFMVPFVLIMVFMILVITLVIAVMFLIFMPDLSH